MLVISHSDIIKVSGRDNRNVYGYSLFTEEFVQAPISECANLPGWVLPLMKDEKVQTRVVLSVYPKPKEAAEAVGVSLRTLVRRKGFYKL